MKSILIILVNVLMSISSFTFANMINNGCKAYDCHRYCISHEISKTPGDNGFKFEVNSIENKYIPEKTYTS